MIILLQSVILKFVPRDAVLLDLLTRTQVSSLAWRPDIYSKYVKRAHLDFREEQKYHPGFQPLFTSLQGQYSTGLCNIPRTPVRLANQFKKSVLKLHCESCHSQPTISSSECLSVIKARKVWVLTGSISYSDLYDNG